MTVIRPNSVSGITSITAQANEINFFRSNGALAGLQLNGVNFNTTTGVSTFNNLDVGGVLTYQDVTNVDSVGIITARSTIDAQGAINLADSIIHTGDTNTKIRFPAADTVTIETAGSERVRIDSSGRLLIGTTTEGNESADELTVASSGNTGITIRSGTSSNASLFFSDATSGADEYRGFVQYVQSDDVLKFGTGTTEKLRITSSGNIGMGGNTNPTNVLHIKTAVTNTAVATIESTATNSYPFLRLKNDAREYQLTCHGGLSDAFTIYDGTSSAHRFTIASDGKIGIGSAIPAAKLDVNGSGSSSVIRGRRTDSNGGYNIFEGYSDINGANVFTVSNNGAGYFKGNVGINQTSPQALLHIGNYETGQNVQQSTVTQYFIDSTRSLKIARQSAGNVTTNAAWYTVATLALAGYSYRCQVSLGGNFTQDVVDIDIQTAYGGGLQNKYSFQMNGKVAAAHSNNRITRARVTTGGLLQVWINNGVDSNTTAKVVLETTCGIYAQNGADNAYPMPLVVDSSSPSIISHHLLNFGVHAQWTWTINASSVRSYTRLSGEEFCGQVNAGNGSNQGVNNTFNAPMDGLYHVDFHVASISATGNNNCLISFYGSMTYNTQNNVQNNDEVYDPRGCGSATQPQQGTGFSTILKMAKGDYFTFDFYRPGGGNGYTDGGGQIFDVCVHKIR